MWKALKRGNDSVCKIWRVNWFPFTEINSMWKRSTRERHFQVKEIAKWSERPMSTETTASFAITRSNVWPLLWVAPLINCLRLKQSNKNRKSFVNIQSFWSMCIRAVKKKKSNFEYSSNYNKNAKRCIRILGVHQAALVVHETWWRCR